MSIKGIELTKLHTNTEHQTMYENVPEKNKLLNLGNLRRERAQRIQHKEGKIKMERSVDNITT